MTQYKWFYRENQICNIDTFNEEGKNVGFICGERDVIVVYSSHTGKPLFCYQGYKTKEDLIKQYTGVTK